MAEGAEGLGLGGSGVHKSLASPLDTETLRLPPRRVQRSLDGVQERCRAHADSGGRGLPGVAGTVGLLGPPWGKEGGLEAEGPRPSSTSRTECPVGPDSHSALPCKSLKKSLKKK